MTVREEEEEEGGAGLIKTIVWTWRRLREESDRLRIAEGQL